MTGFGEAILLYYKRTFNFMGRATRAEYWLASLYLFLLYFALMIIIAVLAGLFVPTPDYSGSVIYGPVSGTFFGLLGLVIIALGIHGTIAGLSLAVRRLHDQDKSGFWMLLSLTGFGCLIILVFMCIGGTRGPNRYGEDPYARDTLEAFS